MNTAEILRELGVPYAETHKAVRRNFLGIEVCPFCGHGGCYFAFARDGRACSCWACGGHRFVEALVRLTGKPYREVFEVVGPDFAGGRESRPTGKYDPPPWDHLHPHRWAKEYLRSRNVDWREAERLWHVGAIGHLGLRYAWKIFFPVYQNGEPKSWTTRSVGDGTTRYVSAPLGRERLSIKTLVYGLDLVRGTAVVCEGPMDALRIGPGAVCTFGAGWTQTQLAKLARVPRRVVCFDSAGDAAGERGGRSLADALAPCDGETLLVSLDAKDAASSGDREIRRLRRLFLD